jgi:hypothetical protein
MNRMIFQVAVGPQSKLYEHCIESVKNYCEKHDITHHVLTAPQLWIKPDPFNSGRSEESYMKYGGYLPIYEKENAFNYIDDYDQIAIIDADIYIRPDSPNIFDEVSEDAAFGAVIERDMPIDDWYKRKIINYSQMQYGMLHCNELDFRPNELGFEFCNMGMIVLNNKNFKPYLQGQTPKEFLMRNEFKNFVDGVGSWKWSTDQTLLNFFIKKYRVPLQKMHWKWNGLFTANNQIDECHFIHFFLKDKLPNKGENVEELMNAIN